MEKKKHFEDFYEAYHFVTSHPANSLDRKVHSTYDDENKFLQCLFMEVVKVNPDNVDEDGHCIREWKQDRTHLNTKTEIWLEYGEVMQDEDNHVAYCHDPDLDCGGDTYEVAILKLANLMWENEYYKAMYEGSLLE